MKTKDSEIREWAKEFLKNRLEGKGKLVPSTSETSAYKLLKARVTAASVPKSDGMDIGDGVYKLEGAEGASSDKDKDKDSVLVGKYIAQICGGLNGRGNQSDYFGAIARLTAPTSDKGDGDKGEYITRIVVTDVFIDVLDDVWMLVVSFEIRKSK